MAIGSDGSRLLRADARHADPLGEPSASSYGTVISAYCADSATGDRVTWEAIMGNIAGLVRPGGMFVTAALRRCRWYLVGGKRFPSANVDEDDLRSVLEPRFDCGNGSLRAWELAEHEHQGYSGIVLGWARRRDPVTTVAAGPGQAVDTVRETGTIRGHRPLIDAAPAAGAESP